jgi:RNA polymerase sigma-B factor
MSQQKTDRQVADRLWADYARTHDPRVREALIFQFERLAYSIANRFAARGVDHEDLCQVARMGLVKAVDRFDPSTSYRFSTFATPTILGEIRRYFRDHSRPVHVPRAMQELSTQVERTSRDLARRLPRVPTAADIAAELGVTAEKVEEALALQETTHPLSLDFEAEGVDSGGLQQCLGREDAGLEHAELRVWARELLGHLSEPQQNLIRLRYFSGLSQREAARRLGLSQMQVSRMERRALEQLRGQMAMN